MMVIYLVSTLLNGCSEIVTSMQLIKHAIIMVATAKEFESPTKNFVRALIMSPRGEKMKTKNKKKKKTKQGNRRCSPTQMTEKFQIFSTQW